MAEVLDAEDLLPSFNFLFLRFFFFNLSTTLEPPAFLPTVTTCETSILELSFLNFAKQNMIRQTCIKVFLSNIVQTQNPIINLLNSTPVDL